MKNTLDSVILVWEHSDMANRTFTFTKADEILIAKIQKTLGTVYGKASIISVIRYALIKAAGEK